MHKFRPQSAAQEGLGDARPVRVPKGCAGPGFPPLLFVFMALSPVDLPL
ncbi:MAG TPA: hypothetical protein VMK12_05985 [Anaeromyxobacteraceae bacterium]|nr:hypothetical protein [Anaeromyxobacteraceae bacterium]